MIKKKKPMDCMKAMEIFKVLFFGGFVCAIAAVLPDGSERVVRATMEGRIGYEIAGANGFGYDPIFFLPEYGKTSAELSPEEKNAISHRGKALRLMKEELKEALS